MVKTLKYEEAMKRLEEIVSQMEGEAVDLDKSLALFEEGVRLVRLCSAKLDEAKKKVEILVKKGDQLVPEPFTGEETGGGKETDGSSDLFR